MKVLITGGAGYIGSHCNRFFHEQGIDTIVLDDLSNGHAEAVLHGKLVVGDVGEKNILKNLDDDIEAIVHFAGLIDVAESVKNPMAYYETNVVKMKKLLDFAVERKIKKFIFSSSAAVYGEPEKIPVEETNAMLPINPYGATKKIGEQMLHDYAKAYGLASCSLRYFNVAGASSDAQLGEAHRIEHHLIPKILQAVQEKKAINMFGDDYPTRDGSCIRDYIHVEDLAEAHFLALKFLETQTEPHAHFFNLGTSHGFSVKEMISAAEKITGEKILLKICPKREGDPAVLVASNERAKKILHWQPKKSTIEKILRDAWQWHQHKKF